MSPQHRRQIRQEVDLIQRFADSYRRKFADLIERMNHTTTTTTTTAGAPTMDAGSLRLCVEAVDMMLATHHQLADAVARLSDDSPDTPTPLRRAA
jgi:hypothetical protein